ncbi:MAG TPA: hypothetical protein IGS53_13420 [Leptolyngbyaceae cyanobacterium M33_DOE_097]|uniref:Uncharacterized protein n=1 Tax=Oscillatoriales cyanobacterium SpSt-418 TaxID=2282169 RepID=A0A7C3KE16_9CYAN|nr:hypothetical protein [Leptolyngbyaceae cyanobacterium M33_DOE_097]
MHPIVAVVAIIGIVVVMLANQGKDPPLPTGNNNWQDVAALIGAIASMIIAVATLIALFL